MSVHATRPASTALTALLTSAIAFAPAAAHAGVAARAGKPHSLLQSRELWATIDVCSPPDQPSTVGVRGSMPGDGRAGDTMYMRFQLQYLEAKDNTWVDLHGGSSGYIAIGSAKIARQGGWSAQLMPAKSRPATRPAYTLRGLVTFQWRRGRTTVHEATRTTEAGRRSLADADPPGYSAAQCVIG